MLRQHFGAAVTESANGLEALKALVQGRFDLMLPDTEMPGMSGIEVWS
jgi:CheY-like chemotaxis protein